MIFKTEPQIRLGGKGLPGIFQSLSVGGEVLLEAGMSFGGRAPRKVIRGFSNKDIRLELLLLPQHGRSAYDWLDDLERLFRGNANPSSLDIDSPHLLARGVLKVIFRSLHSSEASADNSLRVSLIFEEFQAPRLVQKEQPRGNP